MDNTTANNLYQELLSLTDTLPKSAIDAAHLRNKLKAITITTAREGVWSLLNMNDIQTLTQLQTYREQFKNSTEFMEDKKQQELQAMAMIINGLELLNKSCE